LSRIFLQTQSPRAAVFLDKAQHAVLHKSVLKVYLKNSKL